ncbi:MAG: hypothetical protein E6I29_00525 [Chloroflexi bacterium]|nr:MAG: hypothetical protein E6I29_00525 [Chloroflexota bacterium]
MTSRPAPITSTAAAQAAAKGVPRRARSSASGIAITVSAASRFALPRSPSGRNGSWKTHCSQALKHAMEVPSTKPATSKSRWRGLRNSQTDEASRPR